MFVHTEKVTSDYYRNTFVLELRMMSGDADAYETFELEINDQEKLEQIVDKINEHLNSYHCCITDFQYYWDILEIDENSDYPYDIFSNGEFPADISSYKVFYYDVDGIKYKTKRI